MNPLTISIRRDQCGKCTCGVDFSDPCAACPNGNWGPYERCDDGKPLSPPAKIAQLAASFGAAAVKESIAIVKRVPEVSPAEQAERMRLCQSCEDGNGKVLVDGSCRNCGCYMPRKTKWRTVVCPVGKW